MVLLESQMRYANGIAEQPYEELIAFGPASLPMMANVNVTFPIPENGTWTDVQDGRRWEWQTKGWVEITVRGHVYRALHVQGHAQTRDPQSTETFIDAWFEPSVGNWIRHDYRLALEGIAHLIWYEELTQHTVP